jgi:hypothetical protein
MSTCGSREKSPNALPTPVSKRTPRNVCCARRSQAGRCPRLHGQLFDQIELGARQPTAGPILVQNPCSNARRIYHVFITHALFCYLDLNQWQDNGAGSTNEFWRLTQNSDGSYKIVNAYSGLDLELWFSDRQWR